MGREYVGSEGCVVSDVHDAESAPAGVEPRERSELAERVGRLRASAIEACRTRERLPQPLFWSLFHTEAACIREARGRARVVRMLLIGD